VVYLVVAAVLVFLGGIAVVALMGVRVLRRVKALNRAVATAAAEIGEVTRRIEDLKPAPRA
jgi:cell division protein FtsB